VPLFIIKMRETDQYDYFNYMARVEPSFYTEEIFDRMESLTNYIGDQSTFELAISGWSGTGRSDGIVFCDHCYVYAHRIDGYDDCLLLHKVLSPECYFVKDIKMNIDPDEAEEMTMRCKFE